MNVVDLKRPQGRRIGRNLMPLARKTRAGRYFDRLVREVETDLGGREQLSRIELELVRAFCGAAVQIQYLNCAVALDEATEVDPASYSQLASTLLRIGARLGFARRQRDVTPSLKEYLAATERPADDVNDGGLDDID
jgi:hypothetical protein